MKVLPGGARVKQRALRASARVLFANYQAASTALAPKLREAMRIHPTAFVPSPEAIESQTTDSVPDLLQRIIEQMTEITVPAEKLQAIVHRGVLTKIFKIHGDTIYISRHRVKSLLAELGQIEELRGVEIDQALFLNRAKERALLRAHTFDSQVSLQWRPDYTKTSRGPHKYRVRKYEAFAPGRQLRLTNTTFHRGVRENDDSPSVLLVNPIGCLDTAFDLNEQTSFRLDLADRRHWVYQFDPRGIGKNVGEPKEDQRSFFDTYVSADLLAVTEFIYNRPRTKKKPVILIGHSMGGMMAEFMAVRQAYKLSLLLAEISRQTTTAVMTTQKHTRRQVADYLAGEAVSAARNTSEEVDSLAADALAHLEILNSIRGIVTLGSPKIFDKFSHPIFPALLMLNITLPLIGEEKVPLKKLRWLINRSPLVANLARALIHSGNFDDPQAFLAEFITRATDDFPLGVGLQFLKEIYSGKGFRRMGLTKFNYSAHLDYLPADIPLFHVVGSDDILAPAFNLAFIDRDYGQGTPFDFSQFPAYTHRTQQVHQLSYESDVTALDLPGTASQVQGFLVDNLGHLDFLYGRTAEAIVKPLIHRLVEVISNCDPASETA